MSEDFEIKNKVAESGLVNFDLSELSPERQKNWDRFEGFSLHGNDSERKKISEKKLQN